jgi:curved DNA-binding protein CbpA
MPKRDLYRILGVSTQAAPGDIKRAYRRIVFTVHPDVGESPDPERFREVQEAYEVLNDPDRRRRYDVEVSVRPRPLVEETPQAKAPITFLDAFLISRPSLEEVLDRIGRRIFEYPEKTDGPQRRLVGEAILNADEARFGCWVPFNMPCYIRCPRCGGAASQWRRPCPSCHDRGIVESTRELTLEIPPGAKDGETFEVDVGGETSNLLLQIRIVVK